MNDENGSLSIRGWVRDDAVQLRPMVAAFLAAGLNRGGDLLPTARSVEHLIMFGLAFAAAGDPSYVAVDAAGTLLGYIEWGQLALPMDQRWRTCHTFGSFVIPPARHMGIARRLRYAARDRCLDLGIERVIGPVHLMNTDGLKEFIQQGAWPTSMQMEVLL